MPEIVSDDRLGRWDQRVTMRCNQNTYPTLLEHSVLGSLPEIQPLTVTDPTMSTFIRCVHTFKHCNFMLPQHLAALPLADLVETWKLAKHPQFNSERFHGLVQKFGAEYPIHFTRTLLREFLGVDPLPSPEMSATRHSDSPLLRRYFTFWHPIWSLDELIIRREQTWGNR